MTAPGLTIAETTWRPGDLIPDDVTEVTGGYLAWTRDGDWWTAVAPDEERLHVPTAALLECCGEVTAMRLVDLHTWPGLLDVHGQVTAYPAEVSR